MRIFSTLVLIVFGLTLSACPNKQAAPAAVVDAAYDPNPYKNVMPSKIKKEVEQIQDDDDKRNEARRKQAETQ
jgi:hypothetical protein